MCPLHYLPRGHVPVRSNTPQGAVAPMRRLRLLLALLLLMEPSATALRRVLVTGGNKGIGQAICKRILCDHPDTHVLLGSRNQARGEKAVQQILDAVPGAAGRIEALALEVTDDASVAAAAAAVSQKYSTEEAPLHGLVCNAGVGFGRSIPETLAVNLYGAKRCCEAFVPLLTPEVRVRVRVRVRVGVRVSVRVVRVRVRS